MSHNIIYCGMDLTSFRILSQSTKFRICAVNKMNYFLDEKSLNPADHLFKAVYKRHIGKKNAGGLATVYRLIWPLSSDLFKKYAAYLLLLVDQKIDIVDFADPAGVSDYVRNNAIPLIFVNNWWMLPDKIIHAPEKGTINIHPSKLPQYRGSLPTLWSLKNRDAATALSFMKLGTKMDQGDVVAQFGIHLAPREDSISLEQKIEALLRTHLETVLDEYLGGKIAPAVQEPALATYTAKYAEYMEIRWDKETARDIADKINLYPYLWPLDKCFALLGDKKTFFQKAGYDDNTTGQPGEFFVRGTNLFVSTLHGHVICPLFFGLDAITSFRLIFQRKGKTTP